MKRMRTNFSCHGGNAMKGNHARDEPSMMRERRVGFEIKTLVFLKKKKRLTDSQPLIVKAINLYNGTDSVGTTRSQIFNTKS